MKNKEYFDVLNISSNRELVDMVQALMGNKCLGTFFQNESAKLYFNSGLRDEMDITLEELFKDKTMKWEWEKQVREDWHLIWQDHFNPVIIENKLAVIPHWEKDYPLELTIRIKPGMAFGTGHHETTWLMLSQMLQNLKPGMSVLDLGTGSGILSITADKLGANKITSVEFDSDCKTNFFENLKLNGINGQIDFFLMDVLQWTDFNYQYILVNMNRNIILELLPGISIPQGGKMFLTGIMDEDEKVVIDTCITNNLKVVEKQSRGQWICLTVISL